jgi:hypothetical protein
LFAEQYGISVLTEAHNEELFITSSLYCVTYFGDVAYHIPDTHVALEEYWI